MLQTKGAAAAEQVLGGLVEWMGNDLLDGWMYLTIPVFEEVSDLSEELFRACGDYLAWARQELGPNPDAARLRHEERLRVVLERVRALAGRSEGPPGLP
ncbi:MAG TPA: hypothetical protein VEU07_11900 [Candidatus Acidoferrum sp.]|nr:hypothetical protein [Candidatus Acidoferrum sp.]